MAGSGVDLLSNVRKSLADLAELFVMLDEGVFDAVREAGLGFRASNASSATGLAASRVSNSLYFVLPQDVGPENITISMDGENNFVLEFDDEVEWMAMQLFLNLDVSTPRRLYIESRYGGPSESGAQPFPIEYFFRLYSPDAGRFLDTAIQRARVPTGADVFQVYKVEPTPETAELTGRNCLILFFPRPAQQILISKLRVYCI